MRANATQDTANGQRTGEMPRRRSASMDDSQLSRHNSVKVNNSSTCLEKSANEY
jgi:hypothetical protein